CLHLANKIIQSNEDDEICKRIELKLPRNSSGQHAFLILLSKPTKFKNLFSAVKQWINNYPGFLFRKKDAITAGKLPVAIWNAG
ncbi:MAG TPA: hypothetical protein VFD44_00025, partial [Hanamia sp.]|nr:hypothetical protein [Hanamia sp.]